MLEPLMFASVTLPWWVHVSSYLFDTFFSNERKGAKRLDCETSREFSRI
jgi:hypothetical protein